MSIGKKIALGFASSLAILAVVGGIDYGCTVRLIRSRDQVRDTYRAIEALDEISAALNSAMLRLEVYLLSGEPESLESERPTRPQVDAALSLLRTTVADDPARLSLVDALRPQVASWYEKSA